MGNPFDKTKKMQIKGTPITGLYIQYRGRRFAINGNGFSLRSGDTVFVTLPFHHKNKIVVRKIKYSER